MECRRLCKNSASFPVMCYLIDFIDKACTVHNCVRSTKLISSFFKEEIELIISKKTKFTVLGYSLGIEQSKISYFQALSTLR